MAILGFSIVIVHLLVGFGFLIYKLAPAKKKLSKEACNLKNEKD